MYILPYIPRWSMLIRHAVPCLSPLQDCWPPSSSQLAWRGGQKLWRRKMRHLSLLDFSYQRPIFQRMTSLGGDIMLQRGRLPLQQLFNNNNRKQRLAPTNNFQTGSTNNNQFPASINNRMSSIQNYRSQILKNSQQTFSSRRGLGEQSFISTGNKCHHWWDPPFQHHWFAS